MSSCNFEELTNKRSNATNLSTFSQYNNAANNDGSGFFNDLWANLKYDSFLIKYSAQCAVDYQLPISVRNVWDGDGSSPSQPIVWNPQQNRRQSNRRQQQSVNWETNFGNKRFQKRNTPNLEHMNFRASMTTLHDTEVFREGLYTVCQMGYLDKKILNQVPAPKTIELIQMLILCVMELKEYQSMVSLFPNNASLLDCVKSSFLNIKIFEMEIVRCQNEFNEKKITEWHNSFGNNKYPNNHTTFRNPTPRFSNKQMMNNFKVNIDNGSSASSVTSVTSCGTSTLSEISNSSNVSSSNGCSAVPSQSYKNTQKRNFTHPFSGKYKFNK